MLQKNQVYQTQITGISNDGSGVCRIEGMAVFVPMAVVGDILRIKLVKVLKTYAFGIIDSIIEPSPQRIESDCAVHRACGGCSLSTMTYQAELSAKQAFVADAFARLGKIDAPILPILGSAQICHYRNKAQYPLGTDQDGKVIAGFYAKRSHRVVPCTGCTLQPALFDQILTEVVAFFNQHNVSVYDETTTKGLVRHVYLRQGARTKQLMLCLVCTTEKLWFLDAFVQTMTANFPQITSVVVNVNAKNTNVILGERCITVYGSETITDILCGNQIELSPLSFYQVNTEQAERLYDVAKEFAQLSKDSTVVDLYCGAGTIGLSMARDVKRVIGVEVVAPAVENAKRNAAINQIQNIEFLCADASQAAQQFVRDGVCADVVIVDPPRKGCTPEGLQAIANIAPRRIVMVSCNPATAARDCKILDELGYCVEKIQPVDLFPRTNHVECCVLLCRT